MADVPQPQMISRNRGRVKYLKTMVTENVSRGYDSFGHGYLMAMVTRRRVGHGYPWRTLISV